MILAYGGTKYRGWVRQEGAWKPVAITTLDGIEVTAPADDDASRIGFGTAFWTVRKNPLDAGGESVRPYFLYGQCPAPDYDDYGASVSGGSAAAPASTLCANPTASAVDLNEIEFVGEIGKDDTIALAADGAAQTIYVRNAANTEWGWWKKIRQGNSVKSEWVKGGAIAPGTGFWYIRRAPGDLTVRWPKW